VQAQYGMIVILARKSHKTTSARSTIHLITRLRQFISADPKAKEILESRRQGALSVACHPHRTTTRMEIATCYLWDHRKELADLVDVWEAPIATTYFP
jgi:hypothetical protein